MNRICVITSKSTAYYTIVSRLRRAGLPFDSLLTDSSIDGCGIVITTAEESPKYGDTAVAVEDLDENPGVFKGQILAKLAQGPEILLVGIDPGERIGLAVFYGRASLSFGTFTSNAALGQRLAAFAQRVPSVEMVVKIGNGNMASTLRLAEMVQQVVPRATIEIVDESGSSARGAKIRGVQGDQGAAAIIAFRKGTVLRR
jgi:hypothetical protein